MFTTIFRIIKFAWQDFWRNIWLTIITITVITLTFILISLLVVFNDLTSNIIDAVNKKVDVGIYLKNTITEEQKDQLENFLKDIPQIDKIIFVSKEEALENFKTKHKDDETLLASLEELGENPLGPSFIVYSKNIKDYPVILEKINEFKNTDFIVDKDKNFGNYQLFISRFNSFSAKVQQVGLALSIVFGIITILIVFNTIRVSIYTHQEEIRVMKLVGATNFFIRAPYLVEGVAFSIISAFLAYLIFYPLVNIAQPHFLYYFEGTFNLQEYFYGPFIKILAIELLCIIIINILAASIAIRRYLKRQ
jgi:cell division transport system permease protein